MQATIEGELDKRGGKNFGPPSGCGMTVFLDDVSMPEVGNDYCTLLHDALFYHETARQLIHS